MSNPFHYQEFRCQWFLNDKWVWANIWVTNIPTHIQSISYLYLSHTYRWLKLAPKQTSSHIECHCDSCLHFVYYTFEREKRGCILCIVGRCSIMNNEVSSWALFLIWFNIDDKLTTMQGKRRIRYTHKENVFRFIRFIHK